MIILCGRVKVWPKTCNYEPYTCDSKNKFDIQFWKLSLEAVLGITCLENLNKSIVSIFLVYQMVLFRLTNIPGSIILKPFKFAKRQQFANSEGESWILNYVPNLLDFGPYILQIVDNSLLILKPI